MSRCYNCGGAHATENCPREDAMASEPVPICWALFNPATGKVGPTVYVGEQNAVNAAVRQSNRWRTVVAVPLFLYPASDGPDSLVGPARHLLAWLDNRDNYTVADGAAHRALTAAIAVLVGALAGDTRS